MKKIKISNNTFFLPEYKAIVIYNEEQQSTDEIIADKINLLLYKKKE